MLLYSCDILPVRGTMNACVLMLFWHCANVWWRYGQPQNSHHDDSFVYLAIIHSHACLSNARGYMKLQFDKIHYDLKLKRKPTRSSYFPCLYFKTTGLCGFPDQKTTKKNCYTVLSFKWKILFSWGTRYLYRPLVL